MTWGASILSALAYASYGDGNHYPETFVIIGA